jgi:hypothetical protein
LKTGLLLMPARRQLHDISPAEVKAWFGPRATARLDERQCRTVAKKLNKFRWPGEPIRGGSKPLRDADRYWDFDDAIKAAKVLLNAMPAMKQHWRGLTWAPETRDGYPATVMLEQALQTALPFIEWPFGRYQRAAGRKRRKDWHVPSVLVAKILIDAMAASRGTPSLARNAVLVRVTHAALRRMGYRLNVGISGISAHLTRWDQQYGLVRHLRQH